MRKVFDLIDIDKARRLITKARINATCVILIGHYSINVQPLYEQCPNDLQDDLDDLEMVLDCSIVVNDYDDLVADPLNLLSM